MEVQGPHTHAHTDTDTGTQTHKHTDTHTQRSANGLTNDFQPTASWIFLLSDMALADVRH